MVILQLYFLFHHKGITLGIFLGSSLLIEARPQQAVHNSQPQSQHTPFLKEIPDIDSSRRFHENLQEVQQYGRKYADKQYLRPHANDEIANKFLSFDVPDTIEAYDPKLNKIADVPIYLGERSKSYENVYLNFSL